ncbi:MAG TPA: hypothetical protein VK446_04085 [Methylocystis sp.]|nr:hypothetical protein [Methylocystis sp.]
MSSLACLLSVLPIGAHANKVAIAYPLGEWYSNIVVLAEKAPNSSMVDSEKFLAGGYLSGLAVETGSDLIRGTSENSTYDEIVSICKLHPGFTLQQTTGKLAEKLKNN